MDTEILDWEKISGRGNWGTLLSGNGLSLNFRKEFGYDDLMLSQTGKSDSPSGQLMKQMTEKFDSRNFEEILSILETTKACNEILKVPDASRKVIQETIDLTREGFIESVREKHPDYSQVSVEALRYLSSQLKEFQHAFTTCFDTLIYWAINTKGVGDSRPPIFVDLFRKPKDSDHFIHSAGFRTAYRKYINENFPGHLYTEVFFLHGGMHLYAATDHGELINAKWSGVDGGLVHAQESFSAHTSRTPLFACGTSAAKVAYIAENPYLSACLAYLQDDVEDLVIFGHSLSEFDDHIIKAIDNGRSRTIAYGIHSDVGDKSLEMARVKSVLSRHNVLFFTSESHPLGDALRDKAGITS